MVFDVQPGCHATRLAGTRSRWRPRSLDRAVTSLFPSSIAIWLPDLAAKRAAGRVSEEAWLRPIPMYGCNKLYCEHLGR